MLNLTQSHVLKLLDTCTCERCLNGNYDPAAYRITADEINRLDAARPFGLSGHMVAKNEALTIKESVESVLPALDELIVTYQTSKDSTKEILLQLRETYPEKLRIFHYKPYLPPYGRLGNKDESNRYPEGSIHNPANYYNFGLVKHRFAYYMKVDGDQVYFTKKLRKLKQELYQIYHQPDWKKGKLTSQLYRKLFWLNNYLMKIMPFYLLPENSEMNRSLFAMGFGTNAGFTLAGLNINLHEGKLVIAINPLDYNGGVGDTAIIQADSKRIYQWSEKLCYEVFPMPKLHPAGFFWVHFKPIKTAIDGQYKPILAEMVSLAECRNLSTEALLSKATSVKKSKRNQIRKMLITHFWEQDRKFIPELPSLTKKVKQFLKEHV